MIRKKELQLISCLRQNGRISLTHASKKTNIPISTLFEKLKRYHNTIITRPTILLDFEALGYGTRATIFLKTPKEHRRSLETYLQQDERVNTLFKISNGWDFLAETVFKDLQELHKFLEELEDTCPIEKQIHFILEDVKKEAFLTGLPAIPSTSHFTESLKTTPSP